MASGRKRSKGKSQIRWVAAQKHRTVPPKDVLARKLRRKQRKMRKEMYLRRLAAASGYEKRRVRAEMRKAGIRV